MKSDKTLYIIYAGIWYSIKKIDGCANNLGKTSTSKIGEPMSWLGDIKCQQFWHEII